MLAHIALAHAKWEKQRKLKASAKELRRAFSNLASSTTKWVRLQKKVENSKAYKDIKDFARNNGEPVTPLNETKEFKTVEACLAAIKELSHTHRAGSHEWYEAHAALALQLAPLFKRAANQTLTPPGANDRYVQQQLAHIPKLVERTGAALDTAVKMHENIMARLIPSPACA
ncbi:MAG: hypothetical protein KGI97_01215 [Alphaproteobacteria bacterium]|nr:hypothetical protein [Alphaproteobacteria bacterium]